MRVLHKAALICALLIVLSSGTMAQTPAPPVPGPTLDSLPNCNFTETSGIEGLTVGAVIVHFETGRGCVENLDNVFNVASVGKLFVLGAYLERVMTGRSDYGQRLTFSQDYLMGGRTDCLSDADVGEEFSRGTLSELMIACSDNSATWMLMDDMLWSTVQTYIDSLGIDGIGEVIPYSEVDRRKLAFIDPTWETVPRDYASRYLRRRETTGLGQYFSEIPDYSSEQRRQGSANYFNTYTTNTATPRAIADYLIKLRSDLANENSVEGQIARAFFNTLMLTQRQYSTQALPGTIYTGSKNGFDVGLTAEVNFLLESLDEYYRYPDALVIVFTQQTDVLNGDVQRPGDEDGILNSYLRDISPQITQILYPDYVAPEAQPDERISVARFQTDDSVNSCWLSYRFSDYDEEFVDDYEQCLLNTPERNNYRTGDNLTLGMVLNDVQREDLRVNFIYTRPDGSIRSYQTESFFQDSVGFNWFHPVDMVGTWQVDVYVNLKHVISKTVFVN